MLSLLRLFAIAVAVTAGFSCVLVIPIAHAQGWRPTNGPYPECMQGFVLDKENQLFVAGCSELLTITDGLQITHRTSVSGLTDIHALNDGSEPIVIVGSGVYQPDTSLRLPPLSHQVSAATATAFESILFLEPEQGLFRKPAGETSWKLVNRDFQWSDVQFMRADIMGRVFVATDGRLFLSTDDGSTWSQRSSHASLRLLTIAPDGTVWIANDEGALLYSIDSGSTFIAVGLPANSGLVRNLFFRDSSVYCATSAGGLLYSADNGMHWMVENDGLDPADVCGAALFYNSDTLVAYCYTSGLYYKTSHSAAWQRRTLLQKHGNWNSFSCATDQDLFLSSDLQGVYRTTDAGESWTCCFYSPRESVISVVARGPHVVVHTGHGLHHSGNGGRTFDPLIQLDSLDGVTHVVVGPAGSLYALVGLTKLFTSLDGGTSWNALQLPDSSRSIQLVADSSGDLLALGSQSATINNAPVMYRSHDRGISWSRINIPYFVGTWEDFAAAPNGDLYAWTWDNVYRSSRYIYDTWEQWEPRNIHYGLTFSTGDDFYAEGNGGIEHTTDRGKTWSQLDDSKYGWLTTLAFGNTLFLASDVLYRYDPTYSGVQQARAQRVGAGVRARVEASSVAVTISDPSDVDIDLLDILGRPVANIFHGTALPGEYSYPIAAVRSGWYLVRIRCAGTISTLRYHREL